MEFQKALGLFRKWGVKIPKKKAKEAFGQLDSSGGTVGLRASNSQAHACDHRI